MKNVLQFVHFTLTAPKTKILCDETVVNHEHCTTVIYKMMANIPIGYYCVQMHTEEDGKKKEIKTFIYATSQYKAVFIYCVFNSILQS